MADIKIFSRENFSTDFQLGSNGDLEQDSGLESAVAISLFTDARAAADDALPADDGRRRGWFGDSFVDRGIGSKLWLLSRGKLTDQTLIQARTYALEALEWLVTDGVAGTVEVTATADKLPSSTWMLVLSVEIRRGSVVQLSQRYGYAWEGV